MSCFCAPQEEFYCEVLLLDETKLTLTTQQQGIKYWLDPSKTLSEHKDLITTGPPYTLYFGVKFYAEDPCKLKEEITRYQFFLQVKQDVLQGRIPCPLDISAQLAALAIQSELGDYDPYKHVSGYVSEYRFVPDQKEELEDAIETIHKTVTGQVPSEAEANYLGTAKTLDMYGVDLHPVFGENQSEYFLGLTPIGVVVYKNKTQVGRYFWPRITKVHFKETQFELRVVGKDCTETSFFFEAPNKTACKHLWKCCVEHHTFFRMPENDSNTLTRKLSKFGSLGSKHRYSGKTAMQMGRDPSISLPRPDLQVVRTRSKTYPKRPPPTTGLNNGNRSNTKTENSEKEGTAKMTALPSVKSAKVTKAENGGPEEQRGKPNAPWDENAPQSGLYNTANERTKSPKFPTARGRTPSGGSENEPSQNRRRKGQASDPTAPQQQSKQQRRRSRSRGNTSSGSESENSTRDHRKKRNRSRQENEMVDSGPQWEAVLRRQKERSQNDPNHRRSRHRSRSRSPDVQAKEQLWKHIQKELVDPAPDLTEDQLKEIPYKKVETQGDPIKIRHSHSPRSFRQYRRSQCSEGERSVLSEVNARTDLVPPLPVTRTADIPGSSSTPAQKKHGSKDTLLSEIIEHDVKSSAMVVKTVHSPRTKVET
ncbi:band 4.1-like protein 4A isoform X2 [Oncorhynchus tshawytscha]|uniref:FERM domain-containing protein n=1 Tax=Oncorhynchus tshawytscha TaxID=74940 RepID=A0A8C8HBM6_ONCTS|nr:band 4.1-like protein 4A isoform X2 [Oncorhynchus tshawytscha]